MKNFLKSSRAATAIEFAIVFPVLLLLLMGIIDFGFTMFYDSSLNTGIRDVSRAGVPAGYTSMDQINTIMSNDLGGLYNSANTVFIVHTYNTFNDMAADTLKFQADPASFFAAGSNTLPPPNCSAAAPANDACQSGQIVLYGVQYQWGGLTHIIPFVPQYLYSFSIIRDESFN